MPTPERKPADVTGMGKSLDVTGMGFGSNPAFAFLFGAAAAFGGGGLGAQPTLTPVGRKATLSRTTQIGLLAGVYGPVFALPLLVWLVTRSWQRALLISGVVWVCMFFAVGFVGLVVGYRRSKTSRDRIASDDP